MNDYGGVRYYFQYANPVETAEELSQQRRPQLANARPWECSAYYYWWLFLRENEDYKATCKARGHGPCREVYLDFGDILNIPFMDWWGLRGRELFCEPHGAATRAIEINDPHYRDPAHRLVIEVERFGDLDRVIAEVRQIVRDQQPIGDHGRGGRNVSRALYQCFTKPVLHSLRKHYEVRELLKVNPDISHQDLVDSAKLNVGQSPGNVGYKSAVYSTSENYRKEVGRMIDFAGKGVFPIMTEAQIARTETYIWNRQLAAKERREEVAGGLHCIPFGRSASVTRGSL
jgi:hypothetical protein